jgi:hypothetical protein
MLGITSTLPVRVVKYIPASQWKNEYKRQDVDLKALYKSLKPRTPHQIDACCIGFWSVARVHNTRLPTFEQLHDLIG